VAPVVLGRSIGSVEAIWQDIWQATYWFGRMGVSVFTQSAIDIALWDALGKHATDVANVAAMRDALGEDIAIMVDVNMGWTVDEAIVVGRRLDKYNIRWLEEPVVVADFAGYFRIGDALRTRVVGGEGHFTHYDLAPFFDNSKFSTLQPDMMRGGLTQMRRIATLAHAKGMRIAPHLFHELMVQVMAAIPNPDVLEYLDCLDDLWVEPVLPVGNTLTPPDRPGHGLIFKPEALRGFAIKP